MTTLDDFNTRRIKDKEPFKINLDFDIDYWLLLTVIALVAIGLMMIYSTTFDTVNNQTGQPVPTQYVKAQWRGVWIGVIAGTCALVLDYRSYRRFSIPVMAVTIVALALLFPFGELVNGAKRGFLGGGFQPAEVAKLSLILYISHWLSSKGGRIREFRQGLVPYFIIVGLVFGLVLIQPDLSTAAVLLLIAFTVFIVAGAAWQHIAVGLGVSTIVALAIFFFAPFAHIQERVDDFTRGVFSPEQAHFQVRHGLIALANGKFFGRGLGQSVQKFDLLPTPHTDSIFAVIGEEIGFVGSLVVIGLLMFLVYRASQIAKSATDEYGALVATGIASWFMYQTLINLAVVVGIAPTTGMVLPFISYGASSMVMMLIGVGVLLNISRDGRRKQRVLRRQKTP